MNETPWTKKDIRANLLAMFILVCIAVIMLVMKSWIFLIIYIILWVLYIVVGRYVTCRHCDFLGKSCPSWGMGVIAAKLYKRSEKANFLEGGGLLKLFLLDISFIALASLTPIVLYIYLMIIGGVNIIDLMLLIIYSIMLVITLQVHEKLGCSKCPIHACPLCRKHK